MGLKAVYEKFLASPNPLALSQNAVLQYVTTLTTFNEQGPIIRHLETQNKNAVKKRSEKIISAIEGLTSVAVITETTLQFISAGGAYLPNLDNFIIDRVVTFPITHFVHFDQDGKITNIRLSWDQADVLKQVDVIGTRGKNWPVYDGKEQIKLISASASQAASTNPAPPLTPRGRASHGEDKTPPRSASPSKKYIKDPHTSLDTMFKEGQPGPEVERRLTSPGGVVSPRDSAKPPSRDMNELFAGGGAAVNPDGSPNKPYTEKVVPPKGAGHKKFQPSRVFDDEDESGNKIASQPVIAPKGAGQKKFQPSPLFDEENDEPVKERKIYKTNPARYNHFDLGDPDPNDAFQYRPGNKQTENVPIRSNKVDKNASSWDFQDVQDDAPSSRPIVHKPRKDVNSHFELTSEATPPGPQGRRIIARNKAAQGIYRDPVFGEEESEQPLASISGNRKLGKALETNRDVAEDGNSNPIKKPAGQARKDMNAEKGFWDF